jgi:hypothetical protein
MPLRFTSLPELQQIVCAPGELGEGSDCSWLRRAPVRLPHVQPLAVSITICGISFSEL